MNEQNPKLITPVGGTGKLASKAEMHFIWIEHFRCFNRQSFNLSGRYLFELSADASHLSIRDNPGYIEGMWGQGNILNVTALVGQNGAGKSSLLELIRDTFPRFATVPDPKDAKLIVAVERDSGCTILFNHARVGAFEVNDQTAGQVWRNGKVSFPPDFRSNSVFGSYFDDIHFVVYSNEFNAGHFQRKGTDEGPADHIHDISTRYLALHDAVAFSNRPSSPPHALIAHGNMDTLRNVDFLVRCQGAGALLGFPLPNRLGISPVMYAEAEFSESMKAEVAQVTRAVRGEPKGRFLDRLSLATLLNYAKDTASPTILATFKRVWDASQSPTVFDTVVECFHETGSSFGNSPGHRAELLTFCSEECEPTDFGTSGDFLTFAIRDPPAQKRLADFYDIYSRSVMITPYVIEMWDRPVSSGQQSLWNLYSRFWCFKESKPAIQRDVKGPVVVLLDEADQYFHPMLQKELISRLLLLFGREVFRKNSVQVILTSNSPFCLSDVPRDHMILLQAGKDGRCKVLLESKAPSQTFGASIPDLLANEFFMGYSTMGNFARQRLQSLTRWLKGGPVLTDAEGWLTPEIAWRLIQAVGEPLIRKKLEELYEQVAQKVQDKVMLMHLNTRQGQISEADSKRETPS